MNPSSTEVTETATSVGTGDAGARGHGPFREGRGPSAAHGLIKRFNDMLENLPADSGYSHVRYVNLLGTLSGDDDYRDWWDNELHPTEKGFKAVTRKIADELRRLSQLASGVCDSKTLLFGQAGRSYVTGETRQEWSLGPYCLDLLRIVEVRLPVELDEGGKAASKWGGATQGGQSSASRRHQRRVG